jgi:uncharacterized protein with LGFP repeats
MNRRPTKPGAPLVPNEALSRIADRTGRPLAEVVEYFEERIALMTEDGTMSEAAATIAAVSDVAAVFERSER